MQVCYQFGGKFFRIENIICYRTTFATDRLNLYSVTLTAPSVCLNLSSLKYWGITMNILQEKLNSRKALK